MEDEKIKAYEELYKRIPCSVCKEGCFECCTNIIQFHPAEEENMGGYVWNGKCNHLVDGKCSIYSKRPFVCRIYGAGSIMSCEDCTPQDPLTEDQIRQLFKEYKALLNKK